VALGTEWRPPRSATAADDLTSAVFGAQQGLDTAFSHAYRLVQPGLLRYLTVLVAGDAEDVASETWLQVCRDLHTFTGDGDGFRGWVTTIARHRALDHLRARGRRPADPATPETLHGLVASDDTAHQAEESLLRAVVGLDAKSAGRVLAKRPGAVRTAAHRGLRTLERQLQDGQRR
jgi:RNA polymerase sigma-70 factor (ECF subfamily)